MPNSITLKDVNGNAIYPSINASEYTGEIVEGNNGFVSGGEVYTALSGKANNANVVHLTGNEAISGIKEFDDSIRQLIKSSRNKVYRGSYTLSRLINFTPWNDWKEEYKNTNRKPYRMWTYYANNFTRYDEVYENCFYAAKLTINVSSDYTDEQYPNKRFGTIEALCYLINNQIYLKYISSTGIGNSFKISSWNQYEGSTIYKYIRIFSLEPQYDDYIDSIVVDWVSNQFKYSDYTYYFGEFIGYKDFHETDGNDKDAEPFYDTYGSLNDTATNLLYNTFNTILSNPIKSNVYYLTENLDVDLTNNIWWCQLAQDTSIVLVNKTSTNRQVKIYDDTYVTIPAAGTDSLPAKRFMYDTKNNRWYAEKLNQANWNETDEDDPSFIVGKPTLYSFKNYNDEDYRGLNPPYNWNIHTITEGDLTAKKFTLKLPFPVGKATEVSNVRLFGDVYGIRGLKNNGGINGTTFLNGYIDSIVLTLGDSDGNLITNEPTIRKIDSTEFTKSDRNDGENLNQCRFHFSHFGSASSNLQKNTTVASYLLVIVNLPSSTTTKFVVGDQFQILVNWVQF